MIYGLVLAGGQSSRMGRDKASLLFRGQSLRDVVASSLATCTERVFLSLRQGPWPESWNSAEVLFDQASVQGPAAALLAAHAHVPQASWFVIACDFPFVNDDSVHVLKEAHEREKSLLTCYSHEDSTPEPLFAIWQPEALHLLKQNVKKGFWGPMHTLQACSPLLVPLPCEKSNWLLNANTPEDWAKVENQGVSSV